MMILQLWSSFCGTNPLANSLEECGMPGTSCDLKMTPRDSTIHLLQYTANQFLHYFWGQESNVELVDTMRSEI
jgi:hypothetical protein